MCVVLIVKPCTTLMSWYCRSNTSRIIVLSHIVVSELMYQRYILCVFV